MSIERLLSLEGRTALVTGGAMGIGKACATLLAEAGAAVIIGDLDREAADLTAKELADQGLKVGAVTLDVSDRDQVEAAMNVADSWEQGLDILVNNAGIFPSVPVIEMAPEDFARVIEVNLTGTYLCSRAAARRMTARGHGGRIINVTSIDALHPSAVGLAHYDASKHGVWGFTKNLALELAPHGIWVNAIAPGGIATPGVARMSQGAPVDSEVIERFLARIPMHRLGEPEEIGKAVLFLASDMASYMTGSQVVVDGGALLA